MNKGLKSSLILLQVIFSVAASAKEPDLNPNLVTGCAPMGLSVRISNERYASNIGLERQNVIDIVEESIRSTNLFDVDSGQYLHITIQLVREAFSIGVSLERYLKDTGFGAPGTVAVWGPGRATGAHGGNGKYILGYVTQLTEGFLTEYRQANSKACNAEPT